MENRLFDTPSHVLLVEDNPSEIYIARRVFARHFPGVDLKIVPTGSEALDYLHRRAPYLDADRPQLVLLDLNLPGLTGQSVLEAIKGDMNLRTIPVVILTNSDDRDDIARAYAAHANAFLRKPIDPDAFVELLRISLQYWLSVIARAH